MTRILEGIRVLEVASFGFVPAAGAVLAEWGADVIKVEHSRYPDPMRGLTIGGIPPGTRGVTFMWEVFNRGKRGLAVDAAKPEGRDILMQLAARADVFLTNYLPVTRRKLGIDVDDVMAVNPRIVYARGSGQGPNGPDAERGGFDAISYWYRTGMAAAATPAGSERPANMPGPAFGDIQSGMMLAGGIGSALGYRDRTGKGVVVDSSLLASGMWAMQGGIVGTQLTGEDRLLVPPGFGNPLAFTYRTSDGRYLALNYIEPDRYWPELCTILGHPEWIDDPMLRDRTVRLENFDYCVSLIAGVFESGTLAEWSAVLSASQGQWDVIQRVSEVRDDPQAVANGYVQPVDYPSGTTLRLVSAPVQFDQSPGALSPAPDHGAHTTEILMDLGFERAAIEALIAAATIGAKPTAP